MPLRNLAAIEQHASPTKPTRHTVNSHKESSHHAAPAVRNPNPIAKGRACLQLPTHSPLPRFFQTVLTLSQSTHPARRRLKASEAFCRQRIDAAAITTALCKSAEAAANPFFFTPSMQPPDKPCRTSVGKCCIECHHPVTHEVGWSSEDVQIQSNRADPACPPPHSPRQRGSCQC